MEEPAFGMKHIAITLDSMDPGKLLSRLVGLQDLEFESALEPNP